MTTIRSATGLTLVEILIAMAIIVIGIFAAVMLQGTLLQASGDARLSQEVSKLAGAELALRRHARSTAGTDLPCITPVRAGYDCSVTVVPCALSGTTITCNGSVTDVVSRFVTVTVDGPRSASLTMSAMVPR